MWQYRIVKHSNEANYRVEFKHKGLLGMITPWEKLVSFRTIEECRDTIKDQQSRDTFKRQPFTKQIIEVFK